MSLNPEATQWAQKIGERIRLQRKAQNLTLDDLSRLSGATVPTLSYIERGTRDVKLSTLVALADALRIDFADLVAPQGREASSDTHSSIDGYDLDDDA